MTLTAGKQHHDGIVTTQYISGSNSNDPASEVDNIIMLPN